MTSLQEVERLTTLAQKIYPFAHALFPDELLAHQLVMDGLSHVVLSLADEDPNIFQVSHIDWKLVCSQVFHLAQKRTQHTSLLTTPSGNFFKMNLHLRAALMLKHYYKLETSEAGKILGVDLVEFFNFLYQGRELLLKSQKRSWRDKTL